MWIIKNSEGTPLRVVSDQDDTLSTGETRVEATDIEVASAQAVIARQRANEACDEARRARYVAEADPLFFKQQRGEVSDGTWEAKVAEIRASIPKL